AGAGYRAGAALGTDQRSSARYRDRAVAGSAQAADSGRADAAQYGPGNRAGGEDPARNRPGGGDGRVSLRSRDRPDAGVSGSDPGGAEGRGPRTSDGGGDRAAVAG